MMPVAVASTVKSGPGPYATVTVNEGTRAQAARTCPSPTFDARRLKNGESETFPALKNGCSIWKLKLCPEDRFDRNIIFLKQFQFSGIDLFVGRKSIEFFRRGG